MLESNITSARTVRSSDEKRPPLSLSDSPRAADVVDANLVPTSPELLPAVEPLNRSGTLQSNITNSPLKIYHPRMAPSAVTAENAIAAKALMSAQFIHNISATKAARVSNLYQDPPRFENVIGIFG